MVLDARKIPGWADINTPQCRHSHRKIKKILVLDTHQKNSKIPDWADIDTLRCI